MYVLCKCILRALNYLYNYKQIFIIKIVREHLGIIKKWFRGEDFWKSEKKKEWWGDSIPERLDIFNDIKNYKVEHP